MKHPLIFRALLLACVLLLGLSSPAAELRLTEEGAAKAVVVLASPLRAGDLTTKALVSNIKQMSGATLPTITEKELGAIKVEGGRIVPIAGKIAAETYILLGEGETTRQLGLSLEGLGAGGILVQSTGNAIALMARDDGSDSRTPANVRAVFNFLETLGCRCLWPGESGKVVPRKATIVVPEFSVRFTPPIGQRNIRAVAPETRGAEAGLASLGFTVDDYRKAKEDASQTESEGSWTAWNGLGGNTGIVGGAAGGGLRGGWEEHGKAQPEWFALQPDGTRDQSEAKERWRLCVSNPGLVAHVADDIIARLKEKPQTAVSLCPNDGGYSNFCLCEECKKLDAPDGPKVKMFIFAKVGEGERMEVEVPALTDRFVHYWNAVAERVTKVFPEQLFVVEAYSYYSDPPVREKLHPNLVTRYVPATADGWKGWVAAGAKRVYWRPNNMGSGHRDGAISPRSRETAGTLKYLAANGMLATDMDSIFHHWATHGLHYFIAARLSWNPALEFDAILDDYCRTGFGAGAEHVKQYFLLAEKGVIPVVVNRRGQFPEISKETIEGMRASLTAAAKLTENDPPSHRRVAFLRTGMEFTAISSEAHQIGRAIEKGTPAVPTAVNAIMERRWQMMRAILKNQPLAVNVAVVAGHDGPLKTTLSWKGPSEAGKAAKFQLPPGDDWLFEDQSATRK